MAAILRCDRGYYKRFIQKWLEGDEKFSALGISDSQELKDVREWISNNAHDYSIGWVHYDSDVQIKKHTFLEELTIDLGEGEIFQKFSNSLRDIETNCVKLSIIQETGNQASSDGAINFDGVTQNVNICGSLNEPIPPDVSKERQISYLFSEFINDIKSLNGDKSFLFLIGFGKESFNGLSADFKHWFLHFFCRKMALLGNIKICILNQGNVDQFIGLSPDYDQNIPKYLKFNDIVEETKIHMESSNQNYVHFCKGMIDPINDGVQYSEFKRRLLPYIKEFGASVS